MTIKEFFNAMSLISRSLRYKLTVVFSLMSIIPLLICLYLASNYIFPYRRDVLSVSLVILISAFISFLGLKLAKEFVDPIIKMALDAQIIAKGDLELRIDVQREDEIGSLGNSLNVLTRRIKENMNELQSFGEKTKKLNIEIQKRVFTLSSLLQIGNLVSESAELEEVLRIIVEKVAQLEETGCAFLMLIKDEESELTMCAVSGIKGGEINRLRLKVGEGPLGKVVGTGELLVIDNEISPPVETSKLCEDFAVSNLAVLPVTSGGRIVGLLGAGNSLKGFVFGHDGLELIRVFVKQVAIAVENEKLLRRAEELAIKDNLTNLFNEHYIHHRLKEEIKRAICCQRPCSWILFKVDRFKAFYDAYGELETEGVLRRIAQILKEGVTEIDRVARFSDDEFAILLPEKNKKEATRMAEDIRRKIEFVFSEEKESVRRLTVSVGIGENPIDGVTAEDLIERAKQGIKKARDTGGNKVVV